MNIIDTMDKWDQQKLEEVIEKKHGAKEKCMPKTDIVCIVLAKILAFHQNKSVWLSKF